MLSNRKLLLISSGIWFFGEGMFFPFLSIFSQNMGGDVLEITSVWVAYLLVAGLLYILIGHLSDKHISKTYLMVIGYALNAVFTLSYLLVNNYWSLLFVEIGLGVAAAFATPTFEALYAKYTLEERGGLSWGLYGGLAKISTAFAILLGGLIVTYSSYKVLFIVMGFLQLLATFTLVPFLKKELDAGNTSLKRVRDPSLRSG